MDSREALIALNLIEGVGPVRARSLIEHFGDAPSILSAYKHELTRVRNVGEDTAEKIFNWEKGIDLAGELKRISDYGCHVLISSDENYPASLREIIVIRRNQNVAAVVGNAFQLAREINAFLPVENIFRRLRTDVANAGEFVFGSGKNARRVAKMFDERPGAHGADAFDQIQCNESFA